VFPRPPAASSSSSSPLLPYSLLSVPPFLLALRYHTSYILVLSHRNTAHDLWQDSNRAATQPLYPCRSPGTVREAQA
jgi:hypothetical protein